MKTLLVIFGISGDLSKRKLLPALAKLVASKEVDHELSILGISRRAITPNELFVNNAQYSSGSYDELKQRTDVFRMDMAHANDYDRLKQRVADSHSEQVLFYLSVPPFAVQEIISRMGQAGINGPEVKLLIEKPFGTDLESATELIDHTDRYFDESQVYRIDHYMAKEMAQNILVFRQSNALFRRTWSSQFISRIEVIASETLGVGWRAGFYEQTGAMVDIIQSHLLQLLAMTIMDLPASLDESEVSARRLSALEKLKLPPEDTFYQHIKRGQYQGYRKETENPDSTTDTFASLTVLSDAPEWQNVPMTLTTGKHLAEKYTVIRISYVNEDNAQADILEFRIQPREGIEVDLWIKKPGYGKEIEKAKLSFSYHSLTDELPEAYEQVLLDAIRGEKVLFASKKEVLAAWRLLQPVQRRWQMRADDLLFYEKGSAVEDLT